jgi:hypothetical protein
MLATIHRHSITASFREGERNAGNRTYGYYSTAYGLRTQEPSLPQRLNSR